VQIQANKIVRGCALTILALCSMDTSLGQERPEAPTGKQPTIKVQTTLVMVPAIVTGRSGSHIDDLKEEDFEVLRNGKTQKIGFFRHVLTRPELMRSAPAPSPDGFTNAVESNDQRLTIFVVDFLNSSFEEQRTARQQLLKFLSKSLDMREPLSLLALDQAGVRVIHDFTTDPAVLAEALKKVTEQSSSADRPESNPVEETYRMVQGWHSKSGSRNAAAEQSRLNTLAIATNFQAMGMEDRVAGTLEALREIGEAFTGIPGRKSIVWATGGFPFEIDDANAFGARDRGLRDRGLLSAYERAWSALNRANIALYPLDVEELVNPAYVHPRSGHPLPQRLHTNNIVANMEKFAEVTGGKFCNRREDAESCFREAANDSSDYYLIGIYTNAEDTKPGWKKLSVRVHRADLKVRARAGYYEGPPQGEKQQIKEEIETALNSPFDYTAVPLGVQWSAAKEASPDGKRKVAFMFVMAPGVATLEETDNNHLSLEFAAVAKDAKGLPMGAFSKAVEGHLAAAMAENIKTQGVRFPGAMELPSGEYAMIFAVRDNIRQLTGSVLVAIKVP
jgi:VWFA-related protein